MQYFIEHLIMHIYIYIYMIELSHILFVKSEKNNEKACIDVLPYTYNRLAYLTKSLLL